MFFLKISDIKNVNVIKELVKLFGIGCEFLLN